MTDPRTIVERELERVELRPFTLDGFHRRRDRKRRNERITAGLVAAAIGIAGVAFAVRALDTAEERTPASMPRNGDIVFQVGADLYAVHPDGSGDREFRTLAQQMVGLPHALAWSPDGTRLVIGYGEPPNVISRGLSTLYLMNADGTHLRELARCPRIEGYGDCDVYDRSDLAWSPDGSRIAFASDGSVDVLDVESGDMQRLVRCPECYRGDDGSADPAWSPEGSQIAFGTNGSLDVVNADGSGRVSIADEVDDVQHPAWSPDGSSIAFSASDGIYVVGADGSGLARLVSQLADTRQLGAPVWSPDGTHIAYMQAAQVRTYPREATVWIMNADGTDPVAIYRESRSGTSYGPVWSPDGRYLAFTTLTLEGPDPADRQGLFVIGTDGTVVQHLAKAIGPPAWQPLPGSP